MDTLYFSASGSMNKKRADFILSHSNLVILGENHIKTTSPGNPGSIITYKKLEDGCANSGLTPTDILKAIIFRNHSVKA